MARMSRRRCCGRPGRRGATASCHAVSSPRSWKDRLASGSELPLTNERPEPRDVLAVTPAQEAHALARRIVGYADANVVKRALPEAVDGESATPDLAGNLAEGIELRLRPHRDAEHADPATVGRTDEPDGASRCCGRGHR